MTKAQVQVQEQVKVCIRDGCDNPASPKSTKGYCEDCMKQARRAWLTMVREKGAERDAQRQEWAKAWEAGMVAGATAAAACVPEPIQVVNAFTKAVEAISYSKGFAWLRVYPGNCAFARWLVSEHQADPAHRGGVQVMIRGYDQSIERKTAHANAMAQVLRTANVGRAEIYVNSQED